MPLDTVQKGGLFILIYIPYVPSFLFMGLCAKFYWKSVKRCNCGSSLKLAIP